MGDVAIDDPDARADALARERREAVMDEAKQAGIKHRGQHPITIMIVDGHMQAVALGKVLFQSNILTADGHDVFARFLECWCEAGIEDACSCADTTPTWGRDVMAKNPKTWWTKCRSAQSDHCYDGQSYWRLRGGLRARRSGIGTGACSHRRVVDRVERGVARVDGATGVRVMPSTNRLCRGRCLGPSRLSKRALVANGSRTTRWTPLK